MKKILIGVIINGHAGGVDKYIMDFTETLGEDYSFDFLTNSIDTELEALLKSRNQSLIEIPRTSRPVQQYRAMKAILRENNYDAVYLNISTSILFLLAAGAVKGGAEKIIVHSHSSAFDIANPFKKKVMTFLHRLFKIPLCKYATHFCSCSDKASEWMFTKKVRTSGKITKVFNAISTENFIFNEDIREKMRKELDLCNNFVVGHIGNFFSSKNHRFLIDVFARLAERDDSARLLLIGDGELMDAIREKVKSVNLESKVIFAGRKNNANDYLQAMDVFVLPSIFEGLPIVSVEAQVNGLPTLLSDRISSEAKIMNSCEFVSIDSVDAWVDKLLESKAFNRGETHVVNTDYIFDKKNMKAVYETVIGG